MKLYDNIQEIYEYIKANPDEFKDVDVLIQMRYLKEVLTNMSLISPLRQLVDNIIEQFLFHPHVRTLLRILIGGTELAGTVTAVDRFQIHDQ